MKKCNQCGAWIDFVTTQAGRHMPVEPRPVFIRTDRGAENFITREGKMVCGERALPSVEGFGLIAAYAPHWAACGKVSAPMRFCNFSPNRDCKKVAGRGVQPLNNYTCRFRPSSLKCTDKSGLDGLQADKWAGN